MGKNAKIKQAIEYKQYDKPTIKERKHPIVSVGYTKSQKQAFNRIKRNTFVVCKMPLNIESMVEVSKKHRRRPYLIVAKDKDSIYGYKMTSSNLQDKGVIQFVMEDFKKGKIGPTATSYINLNKVYRIPIQNICRIGDPVDEGTLLLLQRSIYPGINLGNDLLPVKGVKPLFLPGDIIRLNDGYGFISDYKVVGDKKKRPEFAVLPCRPMKEERSNENYEFYKSIPTVINIPGTKNFWEVDTDSPERVTGVLMRDLVGFVPREKIQKIREIVSCAKAEEMFEEIEEELSEENEGLL